MNEWWNTWSETAPIFVNSRDRLEEHRRVFSELWAYADRLEVESLLKRLGIPVREV